MTDQTRFTAWWSRVLHTERVRLFGSPRRTGSTVLLAFMVAYGVLVAGTAFYAVSTALNTPPYTPSRVVRLDQHGTSVRVKYRSPSQLLTNWTLPLVIEVSRPQDGSDRRPLLVQSEVDADGMVVQAAGKSKAQLYPGGVAILVWRMAGHDTGARLVDAAVTVTLPPGAHRQPAIRFDRMFSIAVWNPIAAVVTLVTSIGFPVLVYNLTKNARGGSRDQVRRSIITLE